MCVSNISIKLEKRQEIGMKLEQDCRWSSEKYGGRTWCAKEDEKEKLLDRGLENTLGKN